MSNDYILRNSNNKVIGMCYYQGELQNFVIYNEYKSEFKALLKLLKYDENYEGIKVGNFAKMLCIKKKLMKEIIDNDGLQTIDINPEIHI